MDDLDNAMEVLDAMEARKAAASAPAAPAEDDGEIGAISQGVSSGSSLQNGRNLVGSVDGFFAKINVAAVMLTGDLKVGDTIEIENEEYVLRQRVNSMQIDRRDVTEAYEGDDVGIKLSVPVTKGSSVYRLG